MDISRVKINLGKKVIYNGVEYLLSACIIRSNEIGYFYQTELKDLAANSSVVICCLDDVSEILK